MHIKLCNTNVISKIYITIIYKSNTILYVILMLDISGYKIQFARLLILSTRLARKNTILPSLSAV